MMLRRAGLALLLVGLAGCTGMPAWFTQDAREKPAPLVEFKPTANAGIAWRGSVGAAGGYVFTPAAFGGSMYAAGRDGWIARFDAESGRMLWRIDAGRKLSAGVGAGDGLVLAGTEKGEVLAFDLDGKALWQARVSSEILSAPQAADSVVVVRAGDGQIFGLDARTGKRKWVYQRALPALAIRNYAGVTVARGAVFAGFAGGRLVALSLANGNIGWEAAVAQPRGATELERIADIASLPVVDENRVCAVAYQGRLACFDAGNGNLIWARELSSAAGLTVDQRNVYVSDARGAVHALDKLAGASVWKQDKLAARRLSAPASLGKQVAVGDVEGYVHFLSGEDGAFSARIPTDGSPIAAPLLETDQGVLAQTQNGGLFALTVH